jgi:hypothetical protein
MAKKEDFNRDVPLPPGLTVTAIQKAIEYIEKGLADLVEIYLEQANVFSAIVGIYGAKALDATSVYEKNRHLDLAQQRFPDLRKKGSGPNPSPDPTMSLEANKPVIVWRVDVVFLIKEDWKYEGSSAGAEGGGRTHTFGLKLPAARLKGKAVYQRKDVKLSGGKAVPRNGD